MRRSCSWQSSGIAKRKLRTRERTRDARWHARVCHIHSERCAIIDDASSVNSSSARQSATSSAPAFAPPARCALARTVTFCERRMVLLTQGDSCAGAALEGAAARGLSGRSDTCPPGWAPPGPASRCCCTGVGEAGGGDARSGSGGDDTGDDNSGDGGEDDCGGHPPRSLCEAPTANSSTSSDSSRSFACRRARSFSEHIFRSARCAEVRSVVLASSRPWREEARDTERFALVQLGIVCPRPRAVSCALSASAWQTRTCMQMRSWTRRERRRAVRGVHLQPASRREPRPFNHRAVLRMHLLRKSISEPVDTCPLGEASHLQGDSSATQQTQQTSAAAPRRRHAAQLHACAVASRGRRSVRHHKETLYKSSSAWLCLWRGSTDALSLRQPSYCHPARVKRHRFLIVRTYGGQTHKRVGGHGTREARAVLGLRCEQVRAPPGDPGRVVVRAITLRILRHSSGAVASRERCRRRRRTGWRLPCACQAQTDSAPTPPRQRQRWRTAKRRR